MIFLAILAAVFAVYIYQSWLYSKRSFDGISYEVSTSTEEVFQNEDIYIYEEIANDKMIPLPYLKVATSLPAGLNFRITEFDKKTKRPRDRLLNHIQSVFVMKSKQKIRRRWRVNCSVRGVYTVGEATLVASDIFGMNNASKGYKCEQRKNNTVTVLPSPVDLEEHFTSSYYHSGDVIKNHSLLTDPLLIAGARDYTPLDPMNKINWKQTAAHRRLMVNIEEYTQRRRFNIMINMNSRDIEQHPTRPSSPEFIEYCITVAASILDRVSHENVPVKIISNTPPEAISPEFRASDDEIGEKILFTPPYEGKQEILTALRVLAMMKTEISCPVEKMLDYILANSRIFAESGNLIVVSAYISERMIVFHDQMARNGVKVIFYVTTTNQNAAIIPKNIEVYYKAYFDNY